MNKSTFKTFSIFIPLNLLAVAAILAVRGSSISVAFFICFIFAAAYKFRHFCENIDLGKATGGSAFIEEDEPRFLEDTTMYSMNLDSTAYGSGASYDSHSHDDDNKSLFE
jgi:hypothetical protein